MGSRAMKKARIIPECEGEDRISALPDELIHKMMSFLDDVEEAVKTSVLSKRWKLLWTTLPYLNFRTSGKYFSDDDTARSRYIMLIRHVLSNRNHKSSVSELKLDVYGELTVKPSVSGKRFRGCVVKKFIQYAISHNIQDLDLKINGSLGSKAKPYKLCTFSSKSLKKLKLILFREKEFALGKSTDCWDLPALTTLHLGPGPMYDRRLPELWLTCLPALRTLVLDNWDLSETSFSFPNLTTLRLNRCTLPGRVWNLPALLSLHLTYLLLPADEKMSDMLFSTLVNLKDLTLINLKQESTPRDHLFISCPQLLNLYIKIDLNSELVKNIVVSAPKLCNFTSFGIFSIKVQVPDDKLENVNLNLNDFFKCGGPTEKKEYYQQFAGMLSGSGLDTAKNLSFDLKGIEALSEIAKFLASCFSPFFNLKYVKLPKEYEQSTMSPALRSYLLNGSRGATIVTSLPPQRNGILPPPLSVVAEKVAVQVGGTDKDGVSSSKGNRDFGLWEGHEVNSDFVCLLDHIMHKYPETFEHFSPENEMLCTMNLNMLCTSVNDFAKISMAEVNSEIIVEYRDVFANLQNQGFDVSWLVNRLNYIEHLRFSKPLISELHEIDCRIQDLQTLREAKMIEIQNAFGTIGTHLAAGSIGDDLLPNLN